MRASSQFHTCTRTRVHLQSDVCASVVSCTWRVLHSQPLHRHSTPGLTLSSSAFSSCVAFGSRCLPFRFAGVAVHSIPVATTVQHARLRESLAEEGLRWRALSPECAEKRTRLLQRLCAGLGCGRSNRRRWETPRSGGRRPPTLPWRTVGFGCHHGVSIAERWNPTQTCSRRRWGSVAHNPAAEGTHIVRTFRAGASSGVGMRSWREVVRGDQPLPPATRQGQSARSSTTTQDECEAELVEEVEVNAAKAFAQSLLEQRGGTGVDGPTPSHSEVVSDSRHCIAA